MNNEGVSSIVVVDNHMNVLGNISTADVKVRYTDRALRVSTALSHIFTAPYSIFLPASFTKHMYTLHLRYFVHSWLNGGQRLVPCLPRQPRIDTGTHSG